MPPMPPTPMPPSTLPGHIWSLDLTTRIRLVAAQFVGWHYAGTSAENRFPQMLSGLPVSPRLVQAHRGRIDCSSFVAYALIACFPSPWLLSHYKQLQIYDGQRNPTLPLDSTDQPWWSPIHAAEAAKAGRRVAAPMPGRWHLIQSWHDVSPLQGGHTRLAYCVNVTAPLVTLESTRIGNRQTGYPVDGPTWGEVSWDALAGYRGGARCAVLSED